MKTPHPGDVCKVQIFPYLYNTLGTTNQFIICKCVSVDISLDNCFWMDYSDNCFLSYAEDIFNASTDEIIIYKLEDK